MTEEANNAEPSNTQNNVMENKKEEHSNQKDHQSKEHESKEDVDDDNGNDREQQSKVLVSSGNNANEDFYEVQTPEPKQSIEAIKKEEPEQNMYSDGDGAVKQDQDHHQDQQNEDAQNEDAQNEDAQNEDAQNEIEPNEFKDQPNEEQPNFELQIEIEEEEEIYKRRPSLSTSPRITAIKAEWVSKRRFEGSGLPLVVCLRCNNHFFVEKTEQYFTATARHKNLKYAFSLIPNQIEAEIYQLIHIQSGCYLSVKKMGKNWTLSPVNNDDDEFVIINHKDLCFNIIKISNEQEVNLKVSIGWNNKLLTIKEDENDDDAKQNNTEKDTILVFEPEKTEEEKNTQIFSLERVTDEMEEDDLNIMFLLDLVDQPRTSKIGINLVKLRKYKHISSELNELIQQIYVRIDTNKTGYAIYNQVWSQFVQYSQGMVPNIVKKVFEDGINNNYDQDLYGDIANKLIHIKNFISCIDTICEFYENEIKMERLQNKKESALKALDPIDIKLRRLDSDILHQHPFLLQWQNMSSFRRKLYDWKIYIFDKWNSGFSGGEGDAGFFLWRKHLVSIQANYGESIFAFFQFTRWLMMLNCIMSLFYGCLMVTHCLDFNFSSFNYDEYIDMALGNEFTDSWWFYGAYKSEYVLDYLHYNVSFVWIVISVCSAGISVVAILRVLLAAGIYFGDDEYVFSKYVFANYNHSLSHADAVTLQRNSLMIRLHETLLNKLDDEENKLTCILVLKRIIGIILCLIIGVLSGFGIVLLIHFEKSIIIPYVRQRYPLIESISPYIVPAGVSVIKGMTPHIVRCIVLFESYSAEFLFQQTFFRVFILRIFAILVTLFQTAQTAEFTENDDGAACAESQIGMVLYKFILFDMFIEIIFYFVIPEIKHCCGRCCGSISNLTTEEELSELNRKSRVNVLENQNKKKNQHKTEFELAGDSLKAQFDIPGALVDVMYRQGIVWSGMYFSPMIPVLAVIASMTTFFVKKRYLFYYCGRPKKALGVTKQLKFFYGMMLLAIITSFVPFNYFLNRTPNCGPHKNQHVLNQTETTLDQDMPYFLRTFFYYAFNGLLLLPLFILSLVYLGYVRGVKNVHHANSKILKERLLKEKDEKKQILKDYNIRL